jgi:hypothetical protein
LLWRGIDNDRHIEKILDHVLTNRIDPQNAARQIVETWLQKETQIEITEKKADDKPPPMLQ